MKRCWLLCALIIGIGAQAQEIQQQLEQSVQKFLADSQMRAGVIGLYISDASTGAVVYQLNSKLGFTPASTQKIVTSVAAFDLLGAGYRYTTTIAFRGKKINGTLAGSIYINGSGDPTFGSIRYNRTHPDSILKQIRLAFADNGISRFASPVFVTQGAFRQQPLPGGWTWDDMGNYYGAGTWGLNWRENQYDLVMAPGKQAGDSVHIVRTDPDTYGIFALRNLLVTGKKGSGDQGVIYVAPGADNGYVEGTVPVADSFVISGSIPDPALQFGSELLRMFDTTACIGKGNVIDGASAFTTDSVFFTHQSPPLDSIVYWFMKRSINLYGEALLKTIAAIKGGTGYTDTGVAVVRRWFASKGIEPVSLRVTDGSGLSRTNRITPEALGKILEYATKQSWYPAFLQSLPVYNGMTLKSGFVGGMRNFAGYHTSASGKQYVIVIMVNNFEGRAGEIEQKMFRILDVLK